jgi:ParB/RepB/Spo0J family partition protein
MNEIIEKIPLDQIVPDPRNRKHGGRTPEELAGLAESIKAHGVQEPAIVRPVDAEAEGAPYKLVAGERRFLASRLAGVDFLPCIVRPMDDAKALAVQLIENLHRQDIHPLDEAEGYDRLRTEAGYTAELIAQEVGRSPAYVYQRLRLQLLVPEVRGLLEEGEISTAAAMVVARLPEKQQEIAYKANLASGWQRERVTAAYLESWVRQNLLCDLKRAAWRLADAALAKKAGACTECPKRTGVDPGLFEDSGPQKCLDPACYKGKQAAIIKKNRDSLEGTEHLVVSEQWWGTWEEVKKSEPGALRAIVIDGQKPGRLTWAKKVERSSGAAFPGGGREDEDPAAAAARELRAEANRETNRELHRIIAQKAADADPCVILRKLFLDWRDGEDLSPLALQAGLVAPDDEGIDPAEWLTDALIEKTKTMNAQELAALVVAADTQGALEVSRWTYINQSLQPYLELFQINADAVRAEVYAAKGVPLKDPEEEDEEDDEGEAEEGEAETEGDQGDEEQEEEQPEEGEADE